MPELDLQIADRVHRVACAPGGEAALSAAARLLDAEAQALRAQLGRVPEQTLLLMTGLVLADRVAELRAECDALASERDMARTYAAPERLVERIEVPVVPEHLIEAMEALSARAEELAAALEQRLPLAETAAPQG
jgi:cell division protein ZapA